MDKVEIGAKVYTAYNSYYQYFLAIAFLLLIIDLLLVERKNKWLEKLNIFRK